MNKKIWYSVALIALIVGLASAGTYAYLSANRTTSANRFAAGTLDLDVRANGNKLEPFVIENIGADGNISDSKTWTIKNTGSLPGRLLIDLQNIVNEENGCNDHEKAVDPTCEEEGKEGDLGAAVLLKVSLDGEEKVSSTLATDQIAKVGDDWENLSEIILQPDEEVAVTADWSVDPSSYGNEIQSDSVQFDVNFRLIQLISEEAPI